MTSYKFQVGDKLLDWENDFCIIRSIDDKWVRISYPNGTRFNPKEEHSVSYRIFVITNGIQERRWHLIKNGIDKLEDEL